MNNYIKEIRAIIYFLIFFSLFLFLPYFISKFNLEKCIVYIFISYILFWIFMLIVSKYIPWNFLGNLFKIISYPIGIIVAIWFFIIPIFTLFTHLLYYIAIVIAIPIFLFKIFDAFNIIQSLNYETKLYIGFNITVFTSVIFNFQIRKLIYSISPARINSSEKMKPFKLDELTDYFLSENNLRFSIYITYVIALLTINIANFQGLSISSDLISDKAILQSFITFIALDRALVLLKNLEFKPSDLLLKVQKSIKNKIQELLNKQT